MSDNKKEECDKWIRAVKLASGFTVYKSNSTSHSFHDDFLNCCARFPVQTEAVGTSRKFTGSWGE